MIGMAIAVGTTLATHELATLWEIGIAILIGGGIGLITARRIQMTAMPFRACRNTAGHGAPRASILARSLAPARSPARLMHFRSYFF